MVAKPKDAQVGRVLALGVAMRPGPTLALLLAILYLPWIGSPPLKDTLEANRLEVAREMLRSGDWIVPRLGDAIYLAKPPLHPWTIALVSSPFGDVHVALGRAVSALSAIATCWLVLAWGRRELGRRIGILAAFALGTSTVLVRKAVEAELEVLLLLFTTLALFGLWQAIVADRPSRIAGFRLVAGLALGAAVLVKGPPPLLIFVATACVAAWPAFRWKRSLLVSAGCAVAVAVACALLWLVPLATRLGFEPAWDAFQSEFLGRIARAGRTNAEPVWFYAPALLLGLLPVSLLAPCLTLVGPRSAFAGTRARARAGFLWCWAILPVLLFSFSAGKETRYLLPTLPAWALLLAWGWTRARAEQRFDRWRSSLAAVVRIGTWVVPFAWLAFAWWIYPFHHDVVLVTSSLGLLVRLAFVWGARTRRPGSLLAATALAVLTGKFAWAKTSVAVEREAIPIAEVGRTIAGHLEPDEPWILVGRYRSWWQFAVGRRCLTTSDWNGIETVRASTGEPRARYVLTAADAIPPGGGGAQVVGRWVIDGTCYSLLHIP